MMMLVQPVDAVPAPAPGVLSSLFHKSGSTPSTLSSALVPSWLALLAAVVLLSSARAALLYARGRRSRKGQGRTGVVLLKQAEVQEKKQDGGSSLEKKEKAESADKGPPTGARPPSPPSVTPAVAPSPASSSPSPAPAPVQSTAASASIPAPAPARTSWFWGLVSWNRSSLPTLPLQVQRSARQMEFRRRESMSMGRRPQDIEQQQMIQRGLRSPPAFGSARFPSPPPPHPTHPSSSSLPYHTPSTAPIPTAPASMAKMIMSRHTFRRPAARPPPVRSARAVQYSRKYVPPPTPPSESDEEEDRDGELEDLEEGTSNSKTEGEGESEGEKMSV